MLDVNLHTPTDILKMQKKIIQRITDTQLI